MIVIEKQELFARNSDGSIKHWVGKVIDYGVFTNIVVSYGDLDGKMTEKITGIDVGKNIGKSNETTHTQQACRDLEGKVLKKTREGYKDLVTLLSSSSDANTEGKTPNEVLDCPPLRNKILEQCLPKINLDVTGEIKPMKCQPYFKDDGVTPRINFPAIGQPKINGFRCVCLFRKGENTLFGQELKIIFKSKNGLEYPHLEHIEKDIRLFINNNIIHFKSNNIDIEDLVLDGEMYIHNEKLQVISSAVRKYNNNTLRIKFHIFDLAIPNVSQQARLTLLNSSFINETPLNNIIIVENLLIHNHYAAIIYGKQKINEGYEGA